MKRNLTFILLGLLMIPAKYVNAQLVITEFTDDYEDAVIWEGWDLTSATHSLSEADGMLTIAVDKPTEAEKWDGLTMGFGENTLIDLTANGWLSVDIKADDDCLVDISVFDIDGQYNPGLNQVQLTGGADWVSMKFEYAGDNLIHYQWDGEILGTVDASVIDQLLMTFNGGSAWTGTVYMDNMVLGITPTAVITTFTDDYEDAVIWEGWDLTSATHSLTEADGMLTIAVDKPTEAEKWAGLIMGFGENTLIDLTANGWLSVDIKADDDCLVDISVFDINGQYNPGNNQVQLTGGADWVSMKFEHAGDNLIHYQWDGAVLGTVDASVIDHLLMTFNGGSAWTGTVYMDNMVLGITPAAPPAAEITFIVDDSEGQIHTAFAIKGSWDTETGAYDAGWTDGAEHSPFYDDGTHGDDVAGDHIWKVTLSLISDGGTNDWEWGVNDSDGSWIDGNFGFTVVDGAAQTLDPYVIVGSVSVESAKRAINTVHPNPASSTIYIHNNEIISTIELYDMNGQLTLKQIDCGSTSLAISVENQHSGIYLLKTVTNNGLVIFQKLVVE